MTIKELKEQLLLLKRQKSIIANKEFLQQLHKSKLEKRNDKNTNNN